MGKKPGSDAAEADLAPAGWMPANKAEIHMLPRYRRFTRSKRVQMALDVWQAREDEDLSLSQLARDFGVTRVALNRNWKQRLEAAGETYVPKYIGPNSEGLPPTARNPEYDAHKARLKSSAAMAKVGAKSLYVGNERRRVGDFWEFEENYFGHMGCPDCDDKDGNPKRHKPPDFQRDMIARSFDPNAQRLLINVPVYHAKTTLMSVRRSLYQIIKDPNYRLLLVSQTATFAEQIMGSIQEHLMDPHLYYGAKRNLIDDWGPFKDPNRAWSQSQMFVAGRMSSEKDPTIQCLGIGSKHIYGRRADEIVFDDVVDTSRSRNPDQVQADLSWTDKMALSRIGANKGRAIWVGTRVAPGDLYSHLERRPSYDVVKYPAIVDEAEGAVLWPDHFSFEQLLVKKDEMSPADFNLIYQQLELPGAGAAFDEETINMCKDEDRQWGHFEPGWHLVAGLDPAGANAWSGYTSLVLMGVDPVSEKRFLIDAVNVKQMKAPQIFEQMLKWSEEYPLAEWRVESNGLQSQLVQYNDDLNRKLVSRGTRVVPHFTHGNKWDPVFGVESMAPLFRHGMVSIPWASTQARAKFQPLVEQLLQFPMGSVSDLVMAMWFADLGLREKIQRQHLPLFNSRQKVPKRVARRRRVVDFNTGLVRGLTTEEQRPGSLSQTASQVRRVTLGAPYDAANPPAPEPDEGPNFVNV